MKKAVKRSKRVNNIIKNEQYIHNEKFDIIEFYKTLLNNRQKPIDEEWRDVVGYEGLYKVSNYGLVINSRYKIVGTYYGDEFYEDLNKYNCVSLVKDGKATRYGIHRLVALAFVNNPNPTKFNIVNHIDENKHNNYYKNLEWCTTLYNLHYGNADKKRRETLELKKEYGLLNKNK